jgi:uncharacterized membrane protein HdeD (DUF308 family)
MATLGEHVSSDVPACIFGHGWGWLPVLGIVHIVADALAIVTSMVALKALLLGLNLVLSGATSCALVITFHKPARDRHAVPA